MTTILGVSLTGRTVLLVGGGDVAARRAHHLLADGARITIVAPLLSTRTRELLDHERVSWVARPFRAADLDAAWLVHTATGSPQQDREIAALCEERRLFCINAGDGAHGSARIAAQARADDVVVGVTGDVGVDPRRAGRVRDAIAGQMREGRLPLRRRRPASVGRVDLIGGGPGPADLMTVRARRLVAEADVLVIDRLGPGAELVHDLEPDVLVIDVGKTPGHHPVPQEEINALLIAHARAGRRVVRVKGGDPYVFGRGGEEVLACHEAGVPVAVTPGISSALAVPQAAGIPVTHRGTASALHIVSGHGSVTTTTLRALADEDVTTVVLMGVAALPRIVEAALRHGVAAQRPVAIVEEGHTDRQRTLHSTLGTVVDDAEEAAVRNPAIIVFGDVARAGFLLSTSVRTGERRP